MIQNKAHQKLVDDLLFKLGSRRDVRLWPRVVGTFRNLHREGCVKIGMEGESDLQGIVSPEGRFLAIEVKTGSGVLNEAQRRYREMIISFGGIYVQARSVEQAVDDFEKQL